MPEGEPAITAQRVSTAARLTVIALLTYVQILIMEAARGAPDTVIESLLPWSVPDVASARRALSGASWTLWALTWMTLALALLELGRAVHRAFAGRIVSR